MPVLLMFSFTSTEPGPKLRVTVENITQTSSLSGMRQKTRRSSIYYEIVIIIIIIIIIINIFGLDCTEPDLGQIRATPHLLTGAHGNQMLQEPALQCHSVTLGNGQMKTAITHFLSFATMVSRSQMSFRPRTITNNRNKNTQYSYNNDKQGYHSWNLF